VRFAPLIGALIGLAGGAIYWLALQIWPASVAVILAMAATALLSAAARPGEEQSPTAAVLYLLAKYSTLLALSAAKLPFAAPPDSALGLIMLCGYAASYALAGSTPASAPASAPAPAANAAFALALLCGLAPAALLGIPGLCGLAAAILIRGGVAAYLKIFRPAAPGQRPKAPQQLTELVFYLGALATWSYV
jgi:adenosylcobinamide-GDP ribazoletransferase